MRRLLISLALLFSIISSANAQFFYNGRGSASLKWYQIKSDKYKLLYPDYFEPTAIRISNFLDSIQPYIGTNMSDKIIRTPMILYTQSQYSNGLVTWAPKRDEMVTTAPIAMTSTPWLKQLSIHEWRHVVQMSTMKKGLTKVATWVLGEAGIVAGLLVISDWQLEGDAVNAETQLTEYGRGLQPDFTIEYRAMATQPNFLKLKTDKLVCGSYKQHIPDIYKFGYQVMSAAETHLSPTIWQEVFDFSAKWPILIIPDFFYLRKHYKTSIKTITKNTFQELDSIWQPHENTVENFTTITKPDKTYTTYETPLALHDGLLAVRRDFRRPSQFVLIDTAGTEKKLGFTGGISSRPILLKDKIYWTEYKPHPIYQMKNFSVIREYDIQNGKKKRYRNWESNYMVTPIGDSSFAAVMNDKQANGFIQFYDKDFNTKDAYHFDKPTTLHGLANDTVTHQLCFIAVDERGMWIGALDNNKTLKTLREPSAVTLSDLRAEDGLLIFGSIQSGKDEIHAINIATQEEYQLTVSRFGSSQPTVIDSMLYHRTYTPKGWMLAKQKIDTIGNTPVKWSRLPKNVVNPERLKWNVPNTDTIPMVESPAKDKKIKRYSKFPRQFNFHSWAPVAVDFDGLYNERSLKMGFGATGFFQSTLSDMYGSLALGAIAGQFWGVTSFTYTGLPVELTMSAEYGGGDRLIYAPYGSDPTALNGYDPKPYFSAAINASLPLNFSGGHSLRLLKPQFSITHYNTQFYDEGQGKYRNSYQKWDASIWWSSTRRAAYQDIVPRLGYAIRVGVSSSLDNRFSRLYYIWGRGYLPGFAKTHSITLRATAQHQKRNIYNFSGKIMTPRGVVDNHAAHRYYAAAFDYTFPLAYPDWGWNGVLYLKRIYANVFADYSFGQYFNNQNATTKLSNHAYGIDIAVDFNLFRSFEQGLRFTFARPNSSHFYFGLSYDFKF